MKQDTWNSKFGRDRVYEEIEFFDLLDNKNKFMQGYKTYTGIALTVLGFFGLGYLVNADQLGSLINAVLQIVGLVVAIYGNYKVHQKITELS